MCRCERCETAFNRYEEYYRIGDNLYLCDGCKDDIVNSEFCELLGVDIVACDFDEEYERDFEED